MKCGHSSDTQGHVHCFCPSLWRAVFHPRCREILWLELSSQSLSGGVSSTPCATAYSEPLALTEGGFFVCLSQKSIMAGLPCLFPPQHPSLPRSCLLSFLVHHQWATGLEICWLEGHWFKFRVCWYDQEGKMPLWQIILSKWTFHLLSSVGCINAQLQKEILLALVQKWEPVLVGFRWRLVFCSHELIKVLTIKQVFLQFR